jgi:hypothetical protein
MKVTDVTEECVRGVLRIEPSENEGPRDMQALRETLMYPPNVICRRQPPETITAPDVTSEDA